MYPASRAKPMKPNRTENPSVATKRILPRCCRRRLQVSPKQRFIRIVSPFSLLGNHHLGTASHGKTAEKSNHRDKRVSCGDVYRLPRTIARRPSGCHDDASGIESETPTPDLILNVCRSGRRPAAAAVDDCESSSLARRPRYDVIRSDGPAEFHN